MVTLSDYIKNIAAKIHDSITIIENLDDNSESLQILKVEMKHINGYLTIIIRKLENRDNISDLQSELLKLSISYLSENDFFRELEQINEIYLNDPNRIRNIKKLIINSFHKKEIVSLLDEIQMD
tara:strand:+ start:81 stop:452 length:372 start_codon:yes stop_codon:yes gene_type:complete